MSIEKTATGQIGAASALLAILTRHADRPAPGVMLQELQAPDASYQWGVHLTMYGDLSGFEQWRAALDLNPADVDHKHSLGGTTAWLVVTGTAYGVPVALYGFYDLPEPATTWA
ncbi:hypothetical protein ACFVXG_07685 [Kitasatospora sp. NPDC058162]|uniref:hypothetical protein n=1 Tax=Kitasatospora sp. NPDC058162 TaxID=3346362 RepID=UPI0036DE4FFB